VNQTNSLWHRLTTTVQTCNKTTFSRTTCRNEYESWVGPIFCAPLTDLCLSFVLLLTFQRASHAILLLKRKQEIVELASILACWSSLAVQGLVWDMEDKLVSVTDAGNVMFCSEYTALGMFEKQFDLLTANTCCPRSRPVMPQVFSLSTDNA